MHCPTLFTDRLLLRAFRAHDAQAVTDYLQTPEISANTARIPYPYERRMAEENLGAGERTDPVLDVHRRIVRVPKEI